MPSSASRCPPRSARASRSSTRRSRKPRASTRAATSAVRGRHAPCNEGSMALTREQALELATVIEARRASIAEELRKDLGRARSDVLGEQGPGDPGDESVAREIADM